MSARITPLRLEAFEHLPKHARRCVFWEVDPATLGNQDHLADPEFEKEAWLSMVMLEWGSCGQVATAVPDERSHAEPPVPGICALRPAGGGAAGASVSYCAGVRGRGAADVDGGRARARLRRPATQPHRPGDRRVGPARSAGAWRLSAAPRRPPSCRIRARWTPMCGRCWRPSATARSTTASSTRIF